MIERLLITGAAGNLGRILRPQLRSTAKSVRLTDLDSVTPEYAVEEYVQADLTRFEDALRVVQDVNTIVHLAGTPARPGQSEGTFPESIKANLLPTYHVFEAARQVGCRRVIYASSHHVVGFFRQSECIGSDAEHRPDTFYGVAKACGEDLGKLYADKFGLEVVCLRIGVCARGKKPTNSRQLSVWLTEDDAGRLFTAAISAENIKYSIVYGASANARGWWVNSEAADIGYLPLDDSEMYSDALEELAKQDTQGEFQGGRFCDVSISPMERI